MKIKIFATLALLIVTGSAMAFANGWSSEVIASSQVGPSQFEMVFLWLVGLVGLGVARKFLHQIPDSER